MHLYLIYKIGFTNFQISLYKGNNTGKLNYQCMDRVTLGPPKPKDGNMEGIPYLFAKQHFMSILNSNICT